MQQETNDIPMLKHQRAFIKSDAVHTGLVAGFGAGKSLAGTYKTLVKKLMYPGVNVAYYLPTYPLIRDIAFPNFERELTKIGLPFTLNRSDKEFITPYGKIIMRSMDDPNLIVGYEVGYSLIDEADILTTQKMKDAFVKIIGRCRSLLPDGHVNATDMVSTPEGFKFMYDFFVKNASASRHLIKAKTSDNKFLPESYINTLSESYTEEELQAYLNGEFVNLTSGTVFRNFDRKRNHSDREIQKRDVLHIGMDFNITKMSAVVHVTDGPLITAVEEISNAYDTQEMIDIIKEKYKGHTIVVYPDASGNSRNTAGDSDIDLLKKARFKVRVPSKNPSVRSRITLVNVSFLDSKGESTYFVNTHNCPGYTEALEKLPYKNGVPDKDSGFDHPTDAGGYCLWGISQKPKSVRVYA